MQRSPAYFPLEQTFVIDDFAAELLLDAGLDEPPIDAFAVAAALDIEIVRDVRQAGRARLAQLRVGRGQRPVIFLNHDPRPEREHWAVAHELGEHLAPELFARCGLDGGESPRLREEMANAFASRLLLPKAPFLMCGHERDWELPALKHRFATASHELIARRLLDMPPAVVMSVFDQGKLTWRLHNFEGRLPRLSSEEQACQARANETGHPSRKRLDQATIVAWPVHEPDWKREIVRVEVRELFD